MVHHPQPHPLPCSMHPDEPKSNQGMLDDQLERLTKVLENKRIWALNVGENFGITCRAWKRFAAALPRTAVSYLYVSEHHLVGTKLKLAMRVAIRANRRLLGPQDPEVVGRVGNMWWNPHNSAAYATATGAARPAHKEQSPVARSLPTNCTLHEEGLQLQGLPNFQPSPPAARKRSRVQAEGPRPPPPKRTRHLTSVNSGVAASSTRVRASAVARRLLQRALRQRQPGRPITAERDLPRIALPRSRTVACPPALAAPPSGFEAAQSHPPPSTLEATQQSAQGPSKFRQVAAAATHPSHQHTGTRWPPLPRSVSPHATPAPAVAPPSSSAADLRVEGKGRQSTKAQVEASSVQTRSGPPRQQLKQQLKQRQQHQRREGQQRESSEGQADQVWDPPGHQGLVQEQGGDRQREGGGMGTITVGPTDRRTRHTAQRRQQASEQANGTQDAHATHNGVADPGGASPVDTAPSGHPGPLPAACTPPAITATATSSPGEPIRATGVAAAPHALDVRAGLRSLGVDWDWSAWDKEFRGVVAAVRAEMDAASAPAGPTLKRKDRQRKGAAAAAAAAGEAGQAGEAGEQALDSTQQAPVGGAKPAGGPPMGVGPADKLVAAAQQLVDKLRAQDACRALGLPVVPDDSLVRQDKGSASLPAPKKQQQQDLHVGQIVGGGADGQQQQQRKRKAEGGGKEEAAGRAEAWQHEADGHHTAEQQQQAGPAGRRQRKIPKWLIDDDILLSAAGVKSATLAAAAATEAKPHLLSKTVHQLPEQAAHQGAQEAGVKQQEPGVQPMQEQHAEQGAGAAADPQLSKQPHQQGPAAKRPKSSKGSGGKRAAGTTPNGSADPTAAAATAPTSSTPHSLKAEGGVAKKSAKKPKQNQAGAVAASIEAARGTMATGPAPASTLPAALIEALSASAAPSRTPPTAGQVQAIAGPRSAPKAAKKPAAAKVGAPIGAAAAAVPKGKAFLSAPALPGKTGLSPQPATSHQPKAKGKATKAAPAHGVAAAAAGSSGKKPSSQAVAGTGTQVAGTLAGGAHALQPHTTAGGEDVAAPGAATAATTAAGPKSGGKKQRQQGAGGKASQGAQQAGKAAEQQGKAQQQAGRQAGKGGRATGHREAATRAAASAAFDALQSPPKTKAEGGGGASI